MKSIINNQYFRLYYSIVKIELKNSIQKNIKEELHGKKRTTRKYTTMPFTNTMKSILHFQQSYFLDPCL